MSSRRNRPGKCGQPGIVHTQGHAIFGDAKDLIRRLKEAEAKSPGGLHWVSWLDEHEARNLERRGYLREGAATLCFHLTELARSAWGIDANASAAPTVNTH